MMQRLLGIALVLAFVVGLGGCTKDDSTSPQAPASSKAIIVLNSLGTSLSVIDLERDTVYNNVVTVGKWPNHVLQKDGKIYVVNSGSNNIQVFSAENYGSLASIELGAGNNPMYLAIPNTQKAYVTCSQSNCVKVIDLASKTVTKTIAAGVGTTGITIAASKVYATNSAFNGANFTYGQGTVTVINTATDAVVTTINVPMNPQGASVDADGKVHIVCTGDYGTTTGKVVVIDPSNDGTLRTVDVGGSPGVIEISKANHTAYLGTFAGGVITYDTQSFTVTNPASAPLLGKGGSGLVCDASGNVFVGDFANDQVIKMDQNNVTKKTYDVGDGPLSLAVK
jgi:YVTN family beta-propeller protein